MTIQDYRFKTHIMSGILRNSGLARIKEKRVDKPIIVYRYKSRGEVLGEFQSYTELIDLELACNKLATKETILCAVYRSFTGKVRSYFSFHFQCRAVVRLKK